jgi:hypothetical protein
MIGVQRRDRHAVPVYKVTQTTRHKISLRTSLDPRLLLLVLHSCRPVDTCKGAEGVRLREKRECIKN